MKIFKIISIFITIIFFANCSYSETSSTPNNVNFKIGKDGFKSEISEIFSFEELAFGTYITRKNMAEEKGVNLTFTMNDLNNVDKTTLNKYSDAIQNEVKVNLLRLSEYDMINIIFEQTIEEEGFEKIISYKTKRPLN